MPRIAIVGAGFAGLRCADILLRNDASVTIYEARNRIGGRVHQYTAGRLTFDMGPNWIHGTEGNPMSTLAEKTGTVIHEPEERQLIIDASGNAKSISEAGELGAETWATVVEAFKYSNDHHSEIDPEQSLLDFFRKKLSKRFPDDEMKVRERVNEARMWGAFVGDPIDRQSLRNFFLEECLEGETVIVASTYNKILDEVARKAREVAQWRMGEEVVNFEYRKPGEIDSKVALTTARGERDEFDEVIVTCPLGWLKRNGRSAFSPDLPPRLLQAVENISYGHLEKIYVSFQSAWWVEASPAPVVNGTSDDTEDTSSIKVPLFIHFHHPNYHPDPNSKQNEFWNQSVVSLAHFPGSTAKPTLLFYMYGPCSLHMTSMIEGLEPGSEKYNSLLSDFIQPFISRLPAYSATNPACVPTSFVATQWSTDPYAGHGSYSNFQVGLVHGDEDIVCMREAGGLSEDGSGLWLAGEHTAPFVAVGTITGAYWSGEAVARKILGRYGVEDVRTEDGVVNGVVGEGEDKQKIVESRRKDGANLAGLAI